MPQDYAEASRWLTIAAEFGVRPGTVRARRHVLPLQVRAAGLIVLAYDLVATLLTRDLRLICACFPRGREGKVDQKRFLAADASPNKSRVRAQDLSTNLFNRGQPAADQIDQSGGRTIRS